MDHGCVFLKLRGLVDDQAFQLPCRIENVFLLFDQGVGLVALLTFGLFLLLLLLLALRISLAWLFAEDLFKMTNFREA